MSPLRLRAWPALLVIAAAAAAAAPDKAKVEWKPLSVGGLQEIGLLQKGIWKDINEPFRDEWLDQFGVFLTQEALVEERLRITVGFAGIFRFPKPEVAQSEFGGSQYKAFFIGPSIAEGVYRPGGPGAAGFEVGLGLFPFKYNRDAANLGEYLFRSGPYPSFLTTGGLSVTGSAAAPLQGLRARWTLGRLTLDGLLVTETGLPPLYDASLAALAGWTSEGGLLELGAGINYKRLLPVRPSKTTPRNLGNAYFRKDGQWYPGVPEEAKGRAGFHGGAAASGIAEAKARLAAADPSHPALTWLTNPTPANLDSASVAAGDVPAAQVSLARARGHRAEADAQTALADSITAWAATADLEYFSSRGLVAMARASLDLKTLFASRDDGAGLLGPKDLKVYSEVALLGWRNYPLYYTDRLRRIPVMVGVNLPGFRVLDLVSVQAEWFDSPYANNFLSLGSAKATPYFPVGSNREFSEAAYYDAAGKDNLSWSVLLRKCLLPGLEANAQFARDHLRTVGTDWFFGSRLEPNEIIHLSRNWYWTFMMSWSL